MGRKETIYDRIQKKYKELEEKEDAMDELKKDEKQEIEKRGFYIKIRERKYFALSVFVVLLTGYFISMMAGHYAWLFIVIIIDLFAENLPYKVAYILVTHGLYIVIFFRLLIASIFGQNEFYAKKKPIYRFFNNWHSLKWSLIDISDNFSKSIYFFIILIFLLCILYGMGGIIIYQQSGLGGLFPYLFTLFGSILAFYFLSFLGRKLLEYYHPLHSFARLGQKIQYLTPEIEEKSKDIQKNFIENLNFIVLSESFDGLSSAFSQVILLIINLEKVEQKVNKGNLFDSEKYINSLRIDIVEPLNSLKNFFEIQKEELLNSQKELQKLKIGGASEFLSHPELTSKRNKFLITELTLNIDKLERMIEKIK